LPIDFFLRSLAQDQQEHSIGVILSGMGSDGTLGLRAIKEKAGVVLVQNPATAKFNGMPRSAIDAGLADIVAPVEELPGRIMAYLKRTPLTRPAELAQEDMTFRSTRKTPFIAASNGAWASIRLTRLPIISGICRKTRRNWICCSRSC
jgi:two-component system CheB/CheR fusion protein